MYEKAILHSVKWFHRILFQHTITDPNYKMWVHEWYGVYERVHNADIHVQVHYVTSTIVISYEIMEGHSPAVQWYFLYDLSHNLVHLENTWFVVAFIAVMKTDMGKVQTELFPSRFNHVTSENIAREYSPRTLVFLPQRLSLAVLTCGRPGKTDHMQ